MIGVLVALIGVLISLAGVVELGRALGGELEAGLGEVAGHGAVPARIGCERSFRYRGVTYKRVRAQGRRVPPPTHRPSQYLVSLLRELCALPRETNEWRW